MAWNRVAMPLMPWIRMLDCDLATISAHPGTLPRFSGRDVWVMSDYSGAQKSSEFDVMSVLIMDPDQSPEWPLRMREIRKSILVDGKRIAFKSLHDKNRRNAILPFFDASDTLCGLLATVAIHKSVSGICSDERSLATYERVLELEGCWNTKVFESMLRVCHFTSLLIAGLATKQREVIWITDQDNIAANEKKTRDLTRIAAGALTAYEPGLGKVVHFGTSAIDEPDRCLEDLLALPDLAAGASAEFVTHIWRRTKGTLLLDSFPEPPDISHKTCLIMHWHCQTNRRLRRVLWVLNEETRNGKKGLRSRRLIAG